MSESEQKEPRILIANPNRFKPAPEPQEKLTDYQKRIRRDQEKKESRNARLSQGAPYQIPRSKTKSKLLSRDQEFALSGINEMNNRKEILDVKNMLDITPSKQVPEGVNPFLPTPMEVGLIRSEEKEDVISTNPVALDFDVEEELYFDELDTNEELSPNIKRIGGIKRRKSKKLRKSSKKSRKSKRKTTRKVRRHRRRD